MKKKFTSKIKLKIAIEAVKGDMTKYENWHRATGFVCLDSQVETSTIRARALREPHKSLKRFHDEVEKLHANIGRLTVENDFLSRALGRVR